jgi:peptide/nickel transport system permease protein
MLAGALPDFWLALMLVYALFFRLRLLPAPLGRLDLTVTPPPVRTGMLLVDSMLDGNLAALQSAAAHLVLPCFVLAFVYMGAIAKMLRSTMSELVEGDFARYARACGLPERTVIRYALRNALPPVVTVIGITYGYLLGGAVLVETIFSWNGLGQYAVQSILVLDFAAIQGFVLVAALFSVLVYLGVDVLYFAIDPRIRE